jgi:hypothetical protein
MTTTVAPDLKPDHTESEQWPTLGRDPTHATRGEFDPHSFDPTQGRKIGSDPYDDPTAPTTTRVRSGIAPLVVVLALGLAVLVLMLSIPTSDSSPRHASGASTTPHIAR